MLKLIQLTALAYPVGEPRDWFFLLDTENKTFYPSGFFKPDESFIKSLTAALAERICFKHEKIQVDYKSFIQILIELEYKDVSEKS